MSAMNKELERYKHADQMRSQNSGFGPPRPPAPRQDQQQPRVQQGPPFGQADASWPTFRCWNCEQPGHLARQCPSSRRQSRPYQSSTDQPVQRHMDSSRNYRPMQPGPQQPSQASQPPREYRASGVKKSRRVRAASGDSSGSATYLKARVDGSEQDCLLDTGSEVSLLPASLVPKSQIRPTGYTLRTTNGTRVEVLGYAQLPITTELYSLTVDGIVTNHATEVMLGADWLTDNNAQWNFVNSTISLGGNPRARCQITRSGATESSCKRELLSSRGHNKTSSAVWYYTDVHQSYRTTSVRRSRQLCSPACLSLELSHCQVNSKMCQSG